MESAEPLRLLSLDGGGVRGIASLYILKELMDQVRRNIHHSQSTRSGKVGIKPCEYFDLICGTSTGGLIAIMLGRLRYTVDQAITQYRTLAETAFATSSPDGGAGFDSKVLELAIKRLIAQAPAPKAGCLDEDEPYEDLSIDTSGGGCRTFVVATRTRGGHQAVRLRSYATRYNDALNGRIWEAARATSATATFFSPISIGPVLYGDGQTGWNNPAREIFDEAYWIWRGRPVGCLISLGTGEDPIQLPQVQGMTRSSFLGSVTSWFLSPKPSPEEVFRVHDDIMLHLDRDGIRGRYFRFNTPGMSTIGLEEWERIPDIISLTETYMDFPENNERKESVASFIENPTAGWKGYTAGLKEMVVQGAQMRDSERLKNNVTYLYSMGPVPIQESSSISSPTSTSTGINASIVSTDYPLVSLLRVARMFLCVSQSYEPLRSQSSKAYELWLSLEVQMSTFRQKSIMLFAELHEMNGKNAYDALPSAIGNEQAKYLWDSLQEFLQVELSDVIIKFESLLDNIWRLCQNRPTFESIEEVEDQLEGWISKLAIQNSRFTAAISGLSQDPNNRKATNPRFRRSKEISREISIATRKPTSKQTQKRLKSYATVREVSSRLYDSLSQVCFDHATHLAHLRMHPHYTVFGDEEAPYIPFELRLSHSPSLNGKDESCTWLAIKSIIPDSSDVNELQQQHCGLKLGTSNHDWIRNSSSDKACQNRHVHPAASPFRPDKLDFLRHRNFCARLKLYDQNTTENSRKLLGYFGRSNSNEHHVYFSEAYLNLSKEDPIPLAEIFTSARTDDIVPYLATMPYERVELAKKLASTMLQFQGTPLLDASWNSRDDVVFFGSLKYRRELLDKPFLSIQVSAQSTSTKVSSKSECLVHNEYLFNLAILLLEVAYQKPILSLRHEEEQLAWPAAEFALSHNFVRLANRLCESVNGKLGIRYQEVVRKCLNLCLEEASADFLNIELQSIVYTEVVNELEELKQWIIDMNWAPEVED